jgi:glycosyltransferase involved in cell wall biosynthesis
VSISVVYDLSRLVTRVLNATPNGIDRVDWMLARHFLSHRQFEAIALGLGFTGPRLLSEAISRGATDRVAAAWNETSTKGDHSAAYEEIITRLCAKGEATRGGARIVQTRPKRVLNVARALLRYGPALGAAPRGAAPKDAFYLNAANFPLDSNRHVAWLDQRPDIRPVVFVHDLLPLERPDWFWAGEPSRHARRLNLLVRRGAAAIVASAEVEQSLRRRLDQGGRRNFPIFRRGLPVSEIFSEPATLDPRLAGARFFIVCGTIEPRKNHLLLLGIWRDLVARQGADAPKLIIVGNRGWNSKEIVAALAREAPHGRVIEVAGLPTRDYKILLDHCCALLAPSFAEGFGLPVAEALAAGTPIIASDIPPFREQGGDRVTYLGPFSREDWREAILASSAALRRSNPAAGVKGTIGALETGYLAAIDNFLKNL